MLSKVSFMDLFGAMGAVGLLGAGSTLYLINRTRRKVSEQDYYKNAFRLLEENIAAMDMIGVPLKKYRIDLGDTINNQFEDLTTSLKVPFKGSKRSGDLYVWADRQELDSQWNIKRLEIIFNDIKDKKVIVYKNEPKE